MLNSADKSCRFCRCHATEGDNAFCDPKTGRYCGRLWLGIGVTDDERMLIRMRADPAGMSTFGDVFSSFF